MSILLLILGLLMFVGLVVLHELGHFLAARRNGVEVEEFGIGFPPRAKVLARKNGTIYSLNWLPLGGFVKLKGEHDDSTAAGSFGAAPLAAKIKIMLAGVLMNLLAAFVLLTLAAAIGLPRLLPNQFSVASDTKVTKQAVYISYVEPDSPAARAGIEERDRLISITSQNQTYPINQADDLPKLTESLAGQTVQATVERGGQQRQLAVDVRSQAEVEASRDSDDPKGYLGVGPTEFSLQRSTWSAPIVALGLMKQFTVETFKGIGTALGGLFRGDTKAASEQVSGPVGIFVLLQDGSLLGPEFIIFVIAVISLTLAIMNVLPIPALDGGRLFVTLLFRALRRPLTQATEDKIHGTGFLVLMVLFILITIVDVKRFF